MPIVNFEKNKNKSYSKGILKVFWRFIIVGAVSFNFGRFWDMADKSTKIGRNTL